MEAAQAPACGSDQLHVMLFDKVGWLDLVFEFAQQGIVAFGVFSEVGQDDVAGEESMGCGVACGFGFAFGGGGSGGVIL